MTQEYIMKRRMIYAIIFAIITALALAVFIGLYIDETHRVQETYRTQFTTNLLHAQESVESYLDAEGDFDMLYRRILSDISSANSFAFLLDQLTEEQKIAINELHACLLKYPEQMRDPERLKALREAIVDMQGNLDKGFEEAQAIVDSVDKQGH